MLHVQALDQKHTCICNVEKGRKTDSEFNVETHTEFTALTGFGNLETIWNLKATSQGIEMFIEFIYIRFAKMV